MQSNRAKSNRRRLYTSLTHIKQTIRNGEAPPVMALAEPPAFIDTDKILGAGALIEDEEGLTCPVKGCNWKGDFLGVHLSREHMISIGGAKKVREALSIPANTPLITVKGTKVLEPRKRAKKHQNYVRTTRAKAAATRERNKSTIMVKNLRDKCEAQLTQKLKAIEGPVTQEAVAAKYGEGVVSEIKRVYGGWNAFKVAIGLEPIPEHGHTTWTRESILGVLQKFYADRGYWPSSNWLNSTPGKIERGQLPSYRTVREAFPGLRWAQILMLAADESHEEAA